MNHSSTRSTRTSLALTVAALAAAAIVSTSCGGEAVSQPRHPEGPGRPEREPRAVRVVPVERGALPQVVSVSGTLAAQEEVPLALKVSGRLAELSVDLGSRADQGQILGRLVPTDFELRVAQAEAALQQARARLGLAPDDAREYVDPLQTAIVRQAQAMLTETRLRRDRARRLFEEQLLPRSDLDALEAELLVAESRTQDALDEALNRQAVLAQRRSELELARRQLADSVLVAPFAGAVSLRQAAPGEFLAAGQPIVTLVRQHPLRLRLAVPEREAAGIRHGQEVRVTIDGDPTVYRGTVARLSPVIEQSNRTLRLEAEVPNPGGALRPGAFAAAEIVTSADQPVLFVPASAIVPFAGIEKVIVVADGRAKERRVLTGRRTDERVEIVEGVAAGDPVVVEPGNLVDGDPVTVQG